MTYRTRRLKRSNANDVAKSLEASMGYAEVEWTNERMVKLEQKPGPKDGGRELQRSAVQIMQSRQVKVCAKTMQRKRYQEPRVFAVLGKNPLSDLGGRVAVDCVISRSQGRKLRGLGRRDDNRQKGSARDGDGGRETEAKEGIEEMGTASKACQGGAKGVLRGVKRSLESG